MPIYGACMIWKARKKVAKSSAAFSLPFFSLPFEKGLENGSTIHNTERDQKLTNWFFTNSKPANAVAIAAVAALIRAAQ